MRRSEALQSNCRKSIRYRPKSGPEPIMEMRWLNGSMSDDPLTRYFALKEEV